MIEDKDVAHQHGQQGAMWPYYPDLLESPVPRYTSYPTAADFGDLAPLHYGAALQGVAGDVSLYVHIPFCEKICFYCGCNTAAAGRRQRLESYLAALQSEIALIGGLLPQGSKIKRLSFGGGSPNAIAPQQFLSLLDALVRHFSLAEAELSIELDPRSMSAEWGEAIEAAGITRASLGVQTFARHCQLAIGREQSDAAICRTIDWLRAAGVTSLNFDLMYGLPGQTLGDLEDTLDYAALLGADRIALFGYAHVPHIVPRQRMIETNALPDTETRFAMASFGHSFLTSKGYQAIGFDHFSLPGDPLSSAALHRNFQGFTDDTSTNMVGLGASAISSFPGLLAQNEKNSGRYRMLMSQGCLATVRGKHPSADDRLRAKVIEDLLCRGHADLPPCMLNQVRASLQPFRERGLITQRGTRLEIAAHGVAYARAIAAVFDGYRHSSQSRFSAAV